MKTDMTKQQLMDENAALKKKLKKFEGLEKKVKTLEEIAEISQKWFRTFAESSLDGIVTTDEKGSILYWNKAAEKIIGYGKKEVLGKNIFILAGDNQKTYRKKGKSELAQIKEGNFSLRKMLEASWIAKDGTAIQVECSEASWKIGEKIYLSSIFRNITKRKQYEASLLHHKEELERLVGERTDELVKANKKMKDEIVERKKTATALVKREKELEEKSRYLEETNIALRILLEKREDDKRMLGERVVQNVKALIDPYIERLRRGRLNKDQAVLTDIIETNLKNIISPFLSTISSQYYNLTPMEIKVANFIKEGKTNSEIAHILCCSLHTAMFHRYNIRKKLGITNKKVNLRTHLLSFEK